MTQTAKEIQFQTEYIKLCKTQLEALHPGTPPKAQVKNEGCQMNVLQTEKAAGMIKEMGCSLTEDPEEADIIIFNTCTVRENANQKIYGWLGSLKSQKKKNPRLKIVLFGCMMQEQTVIETIKKDYKYVDLVFGTHNLHKFPELLYRSLTGNSQIIDIWEDTDEIVENMPTLRKYPFKTSVNIMFGCNNFCSYCIVPYVRGREKSREPLSIIREIEQLVSQGVTEIMLLGQNVNSYGKTLENPVSFAALLKEIEKVEGLKRIRFMTSHPKDLSDELIEAMAQSDKLCRHFHLPVQSGSDRILKAMNRRYTKARYLELVQKLRKAMPDISLTTDIIVGFPGETEEDFLETLDVVEKSNYDTAFTFIYSRRTGTPAAAMEQNATEAVIKERFQRLLSLVQQKGRENSARFTGEIKEVLVEEENREDGILTGRLSQNLLVHFPGDKSLIGQCVKVRLDHCKGFYYYGTRIS